MRSDRLLLQDIIEAIDEVIGTTPRDKAMFDSDKFVRSHLIRNIQIIGEGVWRLSKEIKDRHPEIPWKIIAGMRHAIVHDYFQIDFDAVYLTAVRDVPPLRSPIAAMLATLPPDLDGGTA
jgi:uncharacterized protein with HEPN domain